MIEDFMPSKAFFDETLIYKWQLSWLVEEKTMVFPATVSHGQSTQISPF